MSGTCLAENGNHGGDTGTGKMLSKADYPHFPFLWHPFNLLAVFHGLNLTSICLATEPGKCGLQALPLQSRAVQRGEGSRFQATRKIEAHYLPKVTGTVVPIPHVLLQCYRATPCRGAEPSSLLRRQAAL